MQAWLLALCGLAAAPPTADEVLGAAQQVRSEHLVRAITALQSVPGRTRVTGTAGAEAARAWVIRTLEGYGVSAARRPFTVAHPFDGGRRYPAVNVVARLGPARGPGLVLVAHLDTKAAEDAAHAAQLGWRWQSDPAPGADDDGSGVAALLELARILGPRQAELRRPVILAFTDAEELAKIAPDGFMEDYGAEALARAFAAQGEEGVALAVDMLLRPRPYGYLLRSYSDGRGASSELEQVVLLAGALVAPELIIEPRLAPGFTYSDHGAFWAQGQGGLLLIEDDFHHPRYHRTSDVFEPGAGYDIRQLEAVTRLLVALAWVY